MRSTLKDLSEFDKKELANLKCESWMVNLLKLNPSYTCWGPGEDYMHIGQGNGNGWDASQIFDTWKDFGPWALDELNECVHFYFKLGRENKACDVCKGDGYHPNAQWISESFYSHSSPFLRETPVLCEACEGSGHIYTAEVGHVGLVLWMLHPRKGCSRGVEIKKLQKEDLPKVAEFLCEAAKRNADRFAGVTGWVKAIEAECQDMRWTHG